jgi:Beta-lactamase enzyme family
MNKGLNMVFSGIFWVLMIGACFAPWIRSTGQINSTSDKKKSKKINEKNLPDSFMYNLLAAYPQFFTSIISPKEALNVQVVYTQIDRDKKGKVKLTDHNFNLNPESYYYPASTVKLPIAILALQKLNELKIPGLDRNTTMITLADGDGQTDVCNDPTASDGRPTIAHYIKKILLVSDDDAFNRLYEFLGQEYINNSLHKMGYTDVQIIHRLQISLPEDQNRHTNPVKFIDANSNIIYEKPAEKSQLIYAARNTKLGKGYMKGTELVNEPFDFSKKNRLTLSDLHTIVKSIMFPDAVSEKKRFNLRTDDYAFLQKYMSMLPRESTIPVYNTDDYWDSYVKFLFYGSEKEIANPDIRIFNKVGDAYGFLIDAAYIADYKSNIEFMVSAVIYCNSDGIFNDDKYDYNTIGLPFLKNIGRVLYDYELKRNRKHTPDLSTFRFQYPD